MIQFKLSWIKLKSFTIKVSVLVVLLYLVVHFISFKSLNLKKQQEFNFLKNQVTNLINNNKQIEEQIIEDLNTEAIEQHARENLNMVRCDERVFIPCES